MKAKLCVSTEDLFHELISNNENMPVEAREQAVLFLCSFVCMCYMCIFMCFVYMYMRMTCKLE